MYSLLIADDEPGIRSIVRKYAEFEGNRVTEAADGMEAVELCRSEKFDIVIMDIMMPELDGFSAVREIRKFSQVPVIMLSARGEEYDKINGFSLGADDYVVKPFSPKELLLRVEAILKRGGRREERAEKEHEIIEMDGGGSHKPEEIPQFIEKLDEGYDCVWGSRFTSGGGNLFA